MGIVVARKEEPRLAGLLQHVESLESLPCSPASIIVFRRVGEEEEWGSTFVQVVGVEGLASHAETSTFVLRSDLGYTGEEPRLDMFENRYFVDVGVELFVKHGGAQWVMLSEFPIERQLLTH